MNLTKSLIARIEDYRKETKSPCKSYATEARAEKVAEEYSVRFANYFEQERPMRYIVAYNEAWGRWVIGFDMTEMLARGVGGYFGVVANENFFTF